MALRDVAHLMRQHGGHFIGAAHRANQPEVHAKITAGQGKRVDAPVADQEKLPGKALIKLGRQLATRAGGSLQR